MNETIERKRPTAVGSSAGLGIRAIALIAVVISQVFFIKYVIVSDFKAASVKPGQVWQYKSGEDRTVTAVDGGIVKYTIPAPSLPDGKFPWECSARIFVVDSKLVTDAK